jgi:hypothetical protein
MKVSLKLFFVLLMVKGQHKKSPLRVENMSAFIKNVDSNGDFKLECFGVCFKGDFVKRRRSLQQKVVNERTQLISVHS